METVEEKTDKKRIPWYMKRIQELEAQLNTQGSASGNKLWADGFMSCMHKYGIMSKQQRQQVGRKIAEHGPDAVKRLKGVRFSAML